MVAPCCSYAARTARTSLLRPPLITTYWGRDQAAKPWGLLLALPWWLHRRDTHRPEPHVVSSLLLLRPGEAPEQMRKTLRHRWLMALRMLLLAVLVLAVLLPALRETLVPEVRPPRGPPQIEVDPSQ